MRQMAWLAEHCEATGLCVGERSWEPRGSRGGAVPERTQGRYCLSAVARLAPCKRGVRQSRVPRHAVAGALGLGLAGQVSHQERVGEQRGKSIFDFSQRDVEQHESTFESEGEKRGSLAFLEAYREHEGASCRVGIHQQVVVED